MLRDIGVYLVVQRSKGLQLVDHSHSTLLHPENQQYDVSMTGTSDLFVWTFAKEKAELDSKHESWVNLSSFES